jgi:hypothetical protein
MKNVPTLISMSLIALFLYGCAGGEVANVITGLKPGDLSKNQAVVVKDFDTANATFSGDNSDDVNIVKSQKKKIGSAITLSLSSKLRQNGFNVHNYGESNIPHDAVVIDGVVTHVNHGSGAARFMVGFGAGSAWMTTTVKMYGAQSPDEVLAEFQVESSTKATGMPGDMTDLLVWDLVEAIAGYILSNSS